MIHEYLADIEEVLIIVPSFIRYQPIKASADADKVIAI